MRIHVCHGVGEEGYHWEAATVRPRQFSRPSDRQSRVRLVRVPGSISWPEARVRHWNQAVNLIEHAALSCPDESPFPRLVGLVLRAPLAIRDERSVEAKLGLRKLLAGSCGTNRECIAEPALRSGRVQVEVPGVRILDIHDDDSGGCA